MLKLWYRIVDFFIDAKDTIHRWQRLPGEVNRLRREIARLEGSAE